MKRALLCWVIGLFGAHAISISGCGEADRTESAESNATQAPVADSAPGPSLSAGAQLEIVEMLREDIEAPRHPSDGGGRAWLVTDPHDGDEPAPIRAAEEHTFRLVYEVGPHGIAVGGVLFLQISPFWEWDTPQTEYLDAPGFTVISTKAAGVELAPLTVGQQLLAIEIGGRPLREGEQVELVFGAGPQRARVDRYAESEARLWFAVDGDGDGIRGLVEDSPTVDIGPREPARLIFTLPSVARPGETTRLNVAITDIAGNAGIAFDGTLELDSAAGIELPRRVTFEAEQGGHREVEVTFREPGIYRLTGRVDTTEGPLVAESNPVLVDSEAPRVLWADLHGHSQISDGTGTPEDYFAYARNIAALDAVALTDHDHWGMRFLDREASLWQRIRAATSAANEPDRFVTILGYEWTSWLHGHRHVLYFSEEDGEGEVYSSIDPAYESPDQLWQALAGKPALTFAHHSAGGPIGTNWDYPPDPILEPVTEITSVHGSSEAIRSPFPIYNPTRGNFVRDVLDRGFRLGMIGSGDSHDGHPGLAHLNGSGAGGLAAIFSEDLTREGILAAMRARRVYATNGARVVLHVTIDGMPMGSSFPARNADEAQTLEFRIASPLPVLAIEIVRGDADPESAPGAVVHEIDGEGKQDWSATLSFPSLRPGEYLYLRVLLEDERAAWSSPFFAETPAQPSSKPSSAPSQPPSSQDAGQS